MEVATHVVQVVLVAGTVLTAGLLVLMGRRQGW